VSFVVKIRNPKSEIRNPKSLKFLKFTNNQKSMSHPKISPPFLKRGDEVAIIAPSFCIDANILASAVTFLDKWGFKARLGNHASGQHGPFSGTDSQRLSDIQEAIDNPSIKAVLCARGGYGLSRIIDRIDFSPLTKSPKWFAGFSDITVLHMWLSEVCGIISIHGEMPLNYDDPEKSRATFTTLKYSLFGNLGPISWKGEFFRTKDVSGEVTGGNLSLLWGLTGTRAEVRTDGKILFLEDVGEYYYHIDRMLTSLRLAGKLANLAALVIGGMNKMNEIRIPWGRTIEETVYDIVKDYDYPVLSGFPAGHVPDNRAFYIGRNATIKIEGKKATLSHLTRNPHRLYYDYLRVLRVPVPLCPSW
jgi:muramoyltetrapeptide carboxypeptidase